MGSSEQEHWGFPAAGSERMRRCVRAPGHDFDHQIRVWLPPSYDLSDRRYPTLWITDGMLELGISALTGSSFGDSPELILVSVGAPAGTSTLEWARRRNIDFLPEHELVAPAYRAHIADTAVGGAARFRDFLIDDLRAQLGSEFRMDPEDHALAGHSAGAGFVLFSLLTRPDGFQRYLLSSTARVVDGPALEAAYAAANDDLEARVFVSVGEAEVRDPWMVWAGVASTTAWIVEALSARSYPSLDLTAMTLPGQSHYSAWALAFVEGVRVLWRERLRDPAEGDVQGMLDDLPWMT